MLPYIVVLLLSLSSFIANPVAAQEDCKTIVSDDARLACYDLQFGVKENSTEAVVDAGRWSVRTETSKMTDTTNVFLRLDSNETIAGRFGGPGNGALWLRCRENTTAVLFAFNNHFMSDIQGYGRIEYRLDKAKMAKIYAAASTDNKTLGLWRGARAIPFIKSMFGKDMLVLRATPFNGSRLTLSYDIRGLEQAIAPLRKACNW